MPITDAASAPQPTLVPETDRIAVGAVDERLSDWVIEKEPLGVGGAVTAAEPLGDTVSDGEADRVVRVSVVVQQRRVAATRHVRGPRHGERDT